jgi:hypothetical protein
MESIPVSSWQFENFSSANEFINKISLPVSPSPPPSPSLYNGVQQQQEQQSIKAPISTRAQLASSILNDLEQGSIKMDMNDFGTNWNEESINLNLFEELAEIEYTPPASPTKQRSITDIPSSVLVDSSNLTIQLPHFINGTESESSADISVLTAEFQAILDSLPKDSDNTEALSQVLEIAGIRTTIIDGEALVPVELDLDLASICDAGYENFTGHNNNNMDMDLDDMNNEISDNDSDIIEESELYEISNQGSPTASVYSNSSRYGMITTNVVDQHSEAAQKILDALLIGDVATAETYLPDIIDVSDTEDDESTMSSEDSFQLLPSSSSHYSNATATTSSVNENKKTTERRGRKKLAKGSVKDKGLRKKEQNKTAATRYRQKKKIEFSLILETEAELQQEHDDLEKKRDNLDREIKMVKQLLRDVIQSKKPTSNNNKAKKSIILESVGLTVSTSTNLIGRNRRK